MKGLFPIFHTRRGFKVNSRSYKSCHLTSGPIHRQPLRVLALQSQDPDHQGDVGQQHRGELQQAEADVSVRRHHHVRPVQQRRAVLLRHHDGPLREQQPLLGGQQAGARRRAVDVGQHRRRGDHRHQAQRSQAEGSVLSLRVPARKLRRLLRQELQDRPPRFRYWPRVSYSEAICLATDPILNYDSLASKSSNGDGLMVCLFMHVMPLFSTFI